MAETFTAPGDDIERVMYGYSILFCLPNGLAERAERRDGHGHAAGHAPPVRPGRRVPA